MSNIIETPTECKSAVIVAEEHSAAEIHCSMNNFYGSSFMIDSCLREAQKV